MLGSLGFHAVKHFTGWTSSQQPRPESAMCPRTVPSGLKEEANRTSLFQTVRRSRWSRHTKYAASYRFPSQGVLPVKFIISPRSATLGNTTRMVFASLSAAAAAAPASISHGSRLLVMLLLVSDSAALICRSQEFGCRSIKFRYLASPPLAAVVDSTKFYPSRQPRDSSVQIVKGLSFLEKGHMQCLGLQAHKL